MLLSKTSLAAALALGIGLVACDGDSLSPTTPVTPPPDVSGTYYLGWALQVLRRSDGFRKEFQCSGQLTLSQAAASGGAAALSGFALVGAPCAPESYDLTGTVVAGGATEFTTKGPRPTEGACPGGTNVHFSGQVTFLDSRWRTLSVRGVTTVQCPQFGEHEFTYLIQGSGR